MILSSDPSIGAGGAKDELERAREFARSHPPAPPAILLYRNSYFATALLFATRAAAEEQLPGLQARRWKDAYVSDLRKWCAGGIGRKPSIKEGMAFTNCAP